MEQPPRDYSILRRISTACIIFNLIFLIPCAVAHGYHKWVAMEDARRGQ